MQKFPKLARSLRSLALYIEFLNVSVLSVYCRLLTPYHKY